MKVNKHDNETQKIINKQFYLYVLMSLIFLITSVLCFLTDDWEMALFVGALSILFFVILLFTPRFFIFDSKKITVKYLVCKKVIHYSSITNIIESKLFESNLPKYEIMYLMKYKGESVIRQLDLPRNKKTKKMLQSYLKSNIIK